MTGLLDTSVVIGPPDPSLPDELAISVMSLAELRLGVLIAKDANSRAARLTRLGEIERLYAPLPIDDDVANAYAGIVAAERERGRKPRVQDVLIAATALANGMTLYTRDEDQARMRGIDVKLLR